MRALGVPVWMLVLGACVLAPFILRIWLDAERRVSKARTERMLRPFRRVRASGIPRAASISRDRRDESDDDPQGPPGSPVDS